MKVEKILGSGPICGSVMIFKNCTWGTEDRLVKVQFVSGRVALHAATGLN